MAVPAAPATGSAPPIAGTAPDITPAATPPALTPPEGTATPTASPIAAPAAKPPAEPLPSLITLTPAEIAAGVALRDENVVIPAAGYREFLRASTDAARRDLESTIHTRVSKLGFTDLSDLLSKIEEEINNQPQETPNMATTSPPAAAAATPAPAAPAPAAGQASPPPPAPAPAQPAATPPAPAAVDDPINDRRLPDATRRRLNKLRDDMRARADAAEQQATQHQQRVTTLEGQIRAAQEGEKLKIAMVRSGVQEVDFAWHILSAELAAMRDSQDPAVKEQLAKFDVATWCANLKATRPYLFGQMPVPATSPAQPHAPAPAPQAPGAVTGQAAAAGAVDLRKATPEQMRARMAELGIPYNRRGRAG